MTRSSVSTKKGNIKSATKKVPAKKAVPKKTPTKKTNVVAIKKAAKMAGLKGEDWVATQTNYLKKIG